MILSRESGIVRANRQTRRTWNFQRATSQHLTNLRVQKKVLTLRGAFAFDTVPHWALKPHLARNGVQGSIINVANEMHKETNIAIYETKMEIENNI